MPVTKRFEVNKYLEDFEEINEFAPFTNPTNLEEEQIFFEEKLLPEIPLWKKWWTSLFTLFSKF